jgi:hypothetical protein
MIEPYGIVNSGKTVQKRPLPASERTWPQVHFHE